MIETRKSSGLQQFLAKENELKIMAETMVMEEIGFDSSGPEYDDVYCHDLPNWPIWGNDAVEGGMVAAKVAYSGPHIIIGEINDAVQDAIRDTAERASRSTVVTLASARARTAPGDENLPAVSVATFAGTPVPERDWLVPELIPGKAVTLLSGDGGVGKSTLAVQLGVATAVGGPWIGTRPKRGPVVFVSAEDSLGENHRRLADIVASQGIELAELSDLYIVPLAGRDAVMGAPKAKGGRIVDTSVWRGLVRIVKRIKPVLVILDTLADVFGGNEIVRTEARQFISQLSGLAIENDLAVVLLAHPSLTGINSGTGTSGSTAWSNSVRSRLYFNRVLDQSGQEADANLRVLKTMKANYAATGDEIHLRWSTGCFVCEGARAGIDGMADAVLSGGKLLADEQDFLRLLAEFQKQGRTVSANKRAGNYAPKEFVEYQGGKNRNVRIPASREAMARLFRENRIHAAADGPPSKGKTKLVVGAAPFEEVSEIDEIEDGEVS